MILGYWLGEECPKEGQSITHKDLSEGKFEGFLRLQEICAHYYRKWRERQESICPCHCIKIFQVCPSTIDY